MRKICVLSTDNNPDYFFYFPIVRHYWEMFGWEVVLFATQDYGGYADYRIPAIDGVRPNTHAQTVRHFVSNVLPHDAYIMVQDIDLIPLQPWGPDTNSITVWGFPEMTGGRFVPVHYTGMTGDRWFRLMDCTGDLKADMEREMKANGRAYKEKWEDYWDTDWDILTKKILAHKHEVNFVPRGMAQCGRFRIPRGRVDRCSIEVSKADGSYSWGVTLDQPELIDAHCENHNPSSPEKWKMIRALLVQCYGEVPGWMDEHVIQHHARYGR